MKDVFEKRFIACMNVIFEEPKFNRRNQECDKTIEEFVTNPHKLAGPCKYDELKEKLICDKLVVGLLGKKLSERLQLDPKFTLDSAVNATKNSEIVKQQQLELCEKESTDTTVEELHRSEGCPPDVLCASQQKRGNRTPKLQVVRQHVDKHPQAVSCIRETLQQLWLNGTLHSSLPVKNIKSSGLHQSSR